MKLNDIKSGYLVELSDGKLYMKMRSGDFDPILISESDSVIELKDLDGDSKLDEKDFKGYVRKVYGLSKDPRASLMFNTEGRQLLYKYINQKEDKKQRGYILIDFYDDGSELSMSYDTKDLLEASSIISKLIKNELIKK